MLSRSVTLALVIGLGLGPGLNPKARLRRPAGALLHSSPTFALRRKGRLSVFGVLLHQFADLCSFVAKDGSVLMIRFRWVRSKPFAPSSQSMAQPSLCGHQQQQACNTIRGYWFRTTGLRPVTPGLLLETAFGRFMWIQSLV